MSFRKIEQLQLHRARHYVVFLFLQTFSDHEKTFVIDRLPQYQ